MGSFRLALKNLLRWIPTVSAVIGIVWAFEIVGAAADPPESLLAELDLSRLNRPIAEPQFRFLGNANCSATACHGGALAGVADRFASRGSEYPLFIERDPHARSWTTLCSKKSSQIMSNLGIMSEEGLVDSRAFRNCLNCHAQPSTEVTQVINAFDLNRSIGCESCHGPAEKWSDTHFRTPVVQASADAKKRSEYQGKVDTKALLSRARLCVTCHVGARDRDMNHDIIAAGHPALYFEMAAQHDHLPKHWREEVGQADNDDHLARMWLAGQLASADAELELLERRMSPEQQGSWPELAVYDCTRCHFQLRANASREKVSKQSDKPGAFRLRRWNLGTLESLIRYSAQSQPLDDVWRERSSQAWSEFVRCLERGESPKTQVVRQLRDDLNQVATFWGGESVQGWGVVDQHRLALLMIESSLEKEDWELTMQAYLAARAALPRPADRSRRDLLEELKSALEFSPNTQSPKQLTDTADGFQKGSGKMLPDLLQRLKREIESTSSAGK